MPTTRNIALVAIATSASFASCRQNAGSTSVAESVAAPLDFAPVLPLPARPSDAASGSQFLFQTSALSSSEREDAIYEQIIQGNVPEFLRKLRPVILGDTRPDSQTSAVIWVLPDYLAIGSDQDFVRIPMNLITATRLAHDLGFVLPTKKMVDAIYAQSAVHAKPLPLRSGGSEISSNAYYLAHDRLISAALGSYPLGELVAGHKKDVVISTRLLNKPGSIVIYGWHQSADRPLQPLSDVHSADYADYSHGIRLVADVTLVNGRPTSLSKAIGTNESASLFTYEGRIERYGQLIDPTFIQITASAM